MKLARPDVFHPRVVLAGCPQRPAGDADDAGLVAALRRRGLHSRWMSWDFRETLQADLVILRAAQDWRVRREEFLKWTGRVKSLLNPPAVVIWNSAARYLEDIETAGVPTLFGDTTVETVSLIFVGGQQSHAVTDTRAVEPEFESWDVGHAALAVAAGRAGIQGSELLCARVDVTAREPVRVVDVNVIAPCLGWRLLDKDARERAQRSFAIAVQSACRRLGLGPLSQRRP
ncbi:hypothetical protein VT930_02815 [Mycobacterium sherrisii]|uniref:hypothetical protein n=1 Tax=Mycobacterium sherrisii TaxID=243061 RepID=UPI002DDCD9A1|nr:hypothetical protein [Mycobacterium sherrisii]MEC4762047.1 hypothetical protein [Mycobacterium sherrisii]